MSKPQRRPRSADATAAEPSMSGGDGPAEGGRAAAGRDRSATAYTRLRELIVHGRLAPGSRIVETDVAERLGVSRTPVRAALQRLEQEGFVLSIGGQQRWRPTIAPLTREDARELFFIIGQIEGLPAGMAAELDDDRRSALVARLRDINRQLLRDSEEGTGDPGHYFELDSCFHRTFVEAVAGPRLLALHDAIKPQAERYIRVYTSALLEKIGTSTNEHEAAIRAIELGDADAAQRAIEQNWRGAARRLGDVIERLGERGSW